MTAPILIVGFGSVTYCLLYLLAIFAGASVSPRRHSARCDADNLIRLLGVSIWWSSGEYDVANLALENSFGTRVGGREQTFQGRISGCYQ